MVEQHPFKVMVLGSSPRGLTRQSSTCALRSDQCRNFAICSWLFLSNYFIICLQNCFAILRRETAKLKAKSESGLQIAELVWRTLRDRLTVGHETLDLGILGSNPSPAARSARAKIFENRSSLSPAALLI